MQYDRAMKRSVAVFSLIVLLSGCALQPDPVPHAPEPEARAVVFDIDGTLTPDVIRVFKVRPHAAAAVQAYADRGYRIIYLTARVRPMQFNILNWLEKHRFPEGSLHVAANFGEGKDHAAFKTKVLNEYVSNGWKLAYAYGDSSTDFEAYRAAGIPAEHIFALLRKSDEQCRPGAYSACLPSWEDHLGFIENVPAVNE